MQAESKRLFINNLPDNISQLDLETKFGKFGNVTSVDIRERKTVTAQQTYHFAYINVEIDPLSLQNCFKEFANKQWKKSYVDVQLAKESFMERLKREREEATNPKPSNGVCNEPTRPVEINNIFPNTKRKFDETNDDDESEHYKPPVPPPEIDKEIYQDIVVKNNHLNIHPRKIEFAGSQSDNNIDTNKVKRKSRDPFRQKCDNNRMNKISEMSRSYQQQKSLIKNALSRHNGTSKNKIVFDEDITKQAEANSATKLNLFNDDDDGEDEYEYNFDTSEQFQGKDGQKLLKLQRSYNNDDRFQLDKRFMENGIDEEENEESVENQEETKESKKKSREMLRFDPLEPEHSKYDITENKEKKKKKKERKPVEVAPLPPISEEKFYKVDDNLKDVFSQNLSVCLLSMFGNNDEDDDLIQKEDENEAKVKESESSIKSSVKSSIKESEPSSHGSNITVKENNPFKYDTSSDEDEGDGDATGDVEKIAADIELAPHKRLGKLGVWNEKLFFGKDDYRLQEGEDFLTKFSSKNNDANENEDGNLYEKQRALVQIAQKKSMNVHKAERRVTRKQIEAKQKQKRVEAKHFSSGPSQPNKKRTKKRA